MTDEMVLWTPKTFSGADMLPVKPQEVELVANIPVVGRENATGEVKMPTLKLLQGMSDEVTEGVQGARPGLFFLTSTQEVLEGPIRALIIRHAVSNVMYPNTKKDPRYKNLEKCMARDGIEGSKYGFCDDCRRHTTWGPNNEPPLCAISNNFTLMTDRGPCVIRLKRKSFPTSRDFIDNWKMTSKNLWHHPVEFKVISETDPDSDSTFYKLKMQWNTSEQVPTDVHVKAFETWETLQKAAEEGRVKEDSDDD